MGESKNDKEGEKVEAVRGGREKLGAQLVSVALIPHFEWYK